MKLPYFVREAAVASKMSALFSKKALHHSSEFFRMIVGLPG
jgi:hypothetical protein